ncbi:UNVERIFIED_CONTAM: hypothetical protein GTU68_034408 [Idotea baltica]|nr:hypothetical protein [Idotea baltica]
MELEVVLSDASKVLFRNTDKQAFDAISNNHNLEGKLYHDIAVELNRPSTKSQIAAEFPKSSIHRRNTGYAVDYLVDSDIFNPESTQPFNFCKLLCGSEGTLAFTTKIKIALDPLPLPSEVVVAVHFNSIHESMKATQVAMKHTPTACELMDKIILDCTKENIEQSKNRRFVLGDPAAILLLEFRSETIEGAESLASDMISDLIEHQLGFHYPVLYAPDTQGVWRLRSAGLGLLANIPGDAKAVACIEDTAVALEDLPSYIADFQKLMETYGQESVYYAHAGAGEIHLRPILNLKQSEDRNLFYKISKASAELVKKYNGSLSGEHGDGRVRAPFIKLMVGEENYQLFKRIKSYWDPKNIFNPGKIVDADPMNESLRYEADVPVSNIETLLDFSDEGDILRTAEKCNGSGDCRKLSTSGGTMCPSYHVTRDEKNTTRGRANILREFLTRSEKVNKFDHEEIKDSMELCLSCKGCTSECPSNVDMSSLKAEFLHQYYKSNKIPLRSKAFAYINKFNQLGSKAPGLYNFLLTNSVFSGIAKAVLQVAYERQLPTIHHQSLRAWYKENYKTLTPQVNIIKTVYLFCDEFTNWNDTHIGILAIKLLHSLGYEVLITDHKESGRAALSKGLLPYAKKMANKNVELLSKVINQEHVLIGIEPSAILTFRDEYPRLVDNHIIDQAKSLKSNSYLIDEFLSEEIQNGNITSDSFSNKEEHIILHGHCHQKSLSNIEHSVWALSLPPNYNVELLATGCCGMAGSFGYEEEHYKISQDIGELQLFPAVRAKSAKSIVAATGTSCRQQIKDGTGTESKHPVEILWDALKVNN